MDRKVIAFEKLIEFKHELKRFVKGVIKSHMFGGVGEEAEQIEFKVVKEGKNIEISVLYLPYYAEFDADVTTRIFNKITPEFFEPIVTQVSKIKKFKGIKFVF